MIRLFRYSSLVNIEAVSAGLYLLSSKYAGNAYDIITDNKIGKIFDPLNKKETVKMLKDLVTTNKFEIDSEYIREKSKKFWNENNVANFVREFKRIVND